MKNQTVEELAQLYLKRREYVRKWSQTKKGKELRSINQMIYQARKAGNWKRVSELEKRRQEVKEEYANAKEQN